MLLDGPRSCVKYPSASAFQIIFIGTEKRQGSKQNDFSASLSLQTSHYGMIAIYICGIASTNHL